MIYLWYTIYIILQCTWGILQTVIGFIIFLLNIKNPHSFYRGCINTKWNSFSGLSMGMFIFTPNEECKELEKYAGGTKEGLIERASMITVHEYGHTYQSIILGPFMIIPGTVSLLWGRMKKYERLRREYGVPYSFCWAESWANRLGEKVTGLPSIGRVD